MTQGLKAPATEDDRHVDWCSSDGVVGLARNPKGRIEIFLEGPQLEAKSRRVRETTEYQTWFRDGGGELLANRIVLPAAGHYEQVAAFLCTELLRNGATSDLAAAFARTEPLIELAIDQLMMDDETVLGLCGEMLLLDALLNAAPVERVGEVLGSWKGHRETARDFQLGQVGVEVKTTTRSTSSHLFRGVHQLEPGHGVDGAQESAFLLASVGLQWTGPGDQSNTISLPELIDGLISRTTDALGAQAPVFVSDLIKQIAAYGSPTPMGYDHNTMAGSSRFLRRFRVQFARWYDMADDGIRLLTTDDMRARPFVDIASLHLRVNLPDQVRGDINPVLGLSKGAARILEEAHPAGPDAG
ncbi:PD-(D/E)XK motif protein [Aquihabitans daechungensis]|uniref:PD-(D/E)XK motif protein n=1 Tax=Aquihabitans daechungensis TaxID=1052257 RepID=UPI003BA30199